MQNDNSTQGGSIARREAAIQRGDLDVDLMRCAIPDSVGDLRVDGDLEQTIANPVLQNSIVAVDNGSIAYCSWWLLPDQLRQITQPR